MVMVNGKPSDYSPEIIPNWKILMVIHHYRHHTLLLDAKFIYEFIYLLHLYIYKFISYVPTY